MQKTRIQSLGWEDPLERKWQPTLAFLLGESHGQRSLAGYSPWGHKESDTSKMTEHVYESVPFQVLFHYRLLKGIKCSSPCYTVGPCLSVPLFRWGNWSPEKAGDFPKVTQRRTYRTGIGSGYCSPSTQAPVQQAEAVQRPCREKECQWRRDSQQTG